jgi:putative phosphonate metabolism protein
MTDAILDAMTDAPRYAIYYAAMEGSALDRFGAALLGYDAITGEELPFPAGIEQAVPDWREITGDPRKYGFHATLKAPMALAEGKTEEELLAACEAFARSPRAIPVIKPVVNEIGDFIAVVPSQRSIELEQLAADAVSALDGLRAALAPADRTRRNPERLTPRQREYLDRWGYPYVMEEFRFHMTLTGRLPDERRATVLAELRRRFATIELETLAIDAIAVFRQQDAKSRFRIVKRYELTRKP